MVPISRSRLRTPASRVYSRMMMRKASSSMVTASGAETVLAQLTRDQIAPRDADLLFLGVAREVDDLHAVAQRRVHRTDLVGRGDEEHLRQIDRHFEVVIAERVVLRRVEHLEQRRRRVALVTRRRPCRARRA